jgi:pyruvate,water dikinase
VNFSEAVPGVVTPLGWSFWHPPFERACRQAFFELGAYPRSRVAPDPPPERRNSAAFYGRVAGNVDVLRELAAALPGSSPNGFEFQVFGAVREGLEDTRLLRRYPIAVVRSALTLAGLSRTVEQARAEAGRWWTATTTSRPADGAAAIRQLRAAQVVFQRVMKVHLLASLLAQGAFEKTVALAKAAGHPELATVLFTSSTELESTSVSTRLWEVSRGRLSLDAFLSDYGFHGPNVGEMSAVSWREDPGPIEPILEAYRRMPDDESPGAVQERRMAERRAAEATLRSSLGPAGRCKASVLLRARRLLALREMGKSSFVQVLDGGRFLARVIGAALVDEGRIDAADDVFLLTMEELDALPDDARDLIAVRRAQRDAHAAVELPDAWIGAAVPRQVSPPSPSAAAVTGLGVAPGIAEGRVRLVLDAGTCDEPLEPGEILVCRMTDPSWAGIMLTAGGLVIDVGGPISHGAIVARELGIPCVINTRDGTRRLATGDYVRVDGGTGEVLVMPGTH